MGHAEVLEAEEHLVLDDGGDHLRIDVLEDRTYNLGDVRERDVAGILPIYERGSEERALEVVRDGARHHGCERGLACSRRPDDADELARADCGCDMGECRLRSLCAVGCGRGVGEGDILELDDGLGRIRAFCHAALSCLLLHIYKCMHGACRGIEEGRRCSCGPLYGS